MCVCVCVVLCVYTIVGMRVCCVVCVCVCEEIFYVIFFAHTQTSAFAKYFPYQLPYRCAPPKIKHGELSPKRKKSQKVSLTEDTRHKTQYYYYEASSFIPCSDFCILNF